MSAPGPERTYPPRRRMSGYWGILSQNSAIFLLRGSSMNFGHRLVPLSH